MSETTDNAAGEPNEVHIDSLMCQAEIRDECDNPTHWSVAPAEPDAGDVEVLRQALSHRPTHWYLAGEHADRRAVDCLGCDATDLSPSDPHFDTIARLADLLDAVRRKAGDERAEQIARAIERQKSIAEESRNIVQTPLPKNNFDQQAWAYGDAARIARGPR